MKLAWLVEFLFPRRLHRVDYFLRSVALEIGCCFIYSSFNSGRVNPVVLWGALAAANAYVAFFLLWPRMRDVGMSGGWVLLCFVPAVNIPLGIILVFRAPKFFPDAPPPGPEAGV